LTAPAKPWPAGSFGGGRWGVEIRWRAASQRRSRPARANPAWSGSRPRSLETALSASPYTSQAAALAEARRLLNAQPERSAALAREVLGVAPGLAEAVLLLGAGLRRGGDARGAVAVLTGLAAAQPGAWGVQFELGLAHAALGDTAPAAAALRRATGLNPNSALAWHALGDQLMLLDDPAGAEAAWARPLPGSLHDPQLVQGAKALFDGDQTLAGQILGDRLGLHLTDPAAVRLLADAGTRLGRLEPVATLLARLLAGAPAFLPARFNAAVVLYQTNRAEDALGEIQRALQRQPGVMAFHALRAAIQARLGDAEAAIDDYATVLERDAAQPRVWLSYGHVLKTVGRQADAVAAYRRSLDLAPGLGEAYWSLANLKTWRFEAGDLARMGQLSAEPDLADEDAVHLDFALGKALEDAGRFEASFEHYRLGNARRRAAAAYDAEANHAYVQRSIATFSPAFLADREGSGCAAPDPIFVVGLPRSGSTLVEQILASHSAVEGASELPDLTLIAQGLAAGGYPESLGVLPPDALAALGEAYLAQTRVHRKLGRPFFVDKFPNNFMHTGLIRLILPQARIIDVRRHPLGCCLSAFKQHFAEGQIYSYDLTDLGRYYVDYVALMDHFDAAAPGRVCRVSYEALVEDPEAQVRRLLSYCGLPFEDQCLRFYESRRVVRTASSEQVRQPIFRDGVDHWRRFEPWLDPLKAALGPVLQGRDRRAD
jgi:tetratricopeptide (TPR) repeat protein